MTPGEFQDWLEARWRKNRRAGDPHRELAIAGLGIGGEAGEVQEHVKKYIRDGKVPSTQALTWELGDVIHYAIRIASEFGIQFEDILLHNVDKLERRERGEKVG